MTNLGPLEDGNESRPKYPESPIGVRHIQAILFFFILVTTYSTRATLSLGIVAMTDKTSSSNPKIPTYDWDNKNVILSSFYWGYILPQFFVGQFSRVHGAKLLLTLSLLLTSMLCVSIPFVAATLGSKGVMGCRIIQGLAQSVVIPSIHGLLGKWVPPNEISTIGTIVYSSVPFSNVIVMPITGLFSASQIGWPASFYTFGIFGFFCTVTWMLLGVNSPEEHRSISSEEKKFLEATLGTKTTKKPTTPWREIFSSLPVWGITVASLGSDWGFSTLCLEIPIYLNKILHFDIETNGFLSAVPYLVLCFLSFFVGPIADYLINNGKISRGVVRKIFNTIGSLVPATALVWLAFIPDNQLIFSIILLVVAVGFNAAWNCGFVVNHMDLSPNHAGTLMGLTNGTSTIFSIIAPLVVDLVVYDETDKSLWRIIFMLAAAIYAVSAIFFGIFGSGELQPWNTITDEEANKIKPKKCLQMNQN